MSKLYQIAGFLGLALSAPNMVASQNFSLNLPTYGAPLVSMQPELDGRSIQEIISTAHPLYSPVEGLPEEYWKEKRCSSCHQWTQRDLCVQGTGYSNGVPDKRHPFGGAFKEVLQFWAETGCE